MFVKLQNKIIFTMNTGVEFEKLTPEFNHDDDSKFMVCDFLVFVSDIYKFPNFSLSETHCRKLIATLFSFTRVLTHANINS